MVSTQIPTTPWIRGKRQWVHPHTARRCCPLQPPAREVAAQLLWNTLPCQWSWDSGLNTVAVLVLGMVPAIIPAGLWHQAPAKGCAVPAVHCTVTWALGSFSYHCFDLPLSFVSVCMWTFFCLFLFSFYNSSLFLWVGRMPLWFNICVLFLSVYVVFFQFTMKWFCKSEHFLNRLEIQII